MKKNLLITALVLFGIGATSQKPTGSFFEFEFSRGSLLNTSSNQTVTGFTNSMTPSTDRNGTSVHAANVISPLSGISLGSANVINTTLSFWFKRRSNTSSRILQCYGTGGRGYRVHMNTTSVGYEGRVTGTSTATISKLTPLTYDTNWHHIVVRTKMGTFGNKFVHDFFLDSVMISTTTTSLSGIITNFMSSASFIVNPITDFTGDVDDIYFYKRYLSDAEVGQLYSYNAPISYVGINEVAPILKVSAFPNPTTSIVSFSSSEKITSIDLYSLSGKKVITVNNSNTIDISTYEKGIYLAKITLENGSVATKKIIKK